MLLSFFTSPKTCEAGLDEAGRGCLAGPVVAGAVDLLEVTPELLLVDGNRFNTYKAIPHECIIKGDGKYLSIAAASILAKTYRDEYMTNLSEKFPEYGWDSNAGYPTKKHRAAIKEFGSTEHHRHSFTLLPRQIDLFT